MIRIALIGPRDREELVRLSIRLEERGAEGVFLDSRADPDIRIAPGRESACGVDLSDVRGAYIADLGLPSPFVRKENGEIDEEGSREALSSSRRRLSVWNALLSRMAARCRVVNPPRTHDLHSLKPWEMSVYVREGVPVPVTVSTSDARSLVDLPREAPAAWVRKGMVGGYGYTEEFIPPSFQEEAREALREGPLMVQERIMGENLRAFVLGGKVIGAAEVISRAGGETDSRRGDIRLRRAALPEEAARDAVRAVGRWGMPFAAVDFMVDARTRRYLVLECNSAPFFVNFEKMTGLPISARLAEYLIGA